MTRKQVENAPGLLEASEHLLYILSVSKLQAHSFYVNDAMEKLQKYIDASREPFHINNGAEIPFPDMPSPQRKKRK